MYINNLSILWVIGIILIIIFISIQFTLNQILKELRRIRNTDMSSYEQHYSRRRDI